MEKTNFKPGPELTFKSVVTIRAKLNAALTDSSDLLFCLDLSEVTQCDSAGIALLIEARKMCKQSNKKLVVIGLSQETQSLAEFCGVNGLLETAKI